MKSSLSFLLHFGVALTLVGSLAAQKTGLLSSSKHSVQSAPARASDITRWNVKLSDPLPSHEPAPAKFQPVPIDFQVLSTRTTQQWVSRTAEFPDLPPVEGNINVTVQKVADPGLPDPKRRDPSTLSQEPLDPARQAEIAEFLEKHSSDPSFFIAATIYQDEPGHDGPRSFIKIHPKDKPEDQIAAWSNIDLRHLTPYTDYEIEAQNGSRQKISFTLFIDPGSSVSFRERAREHGMEIKAPDIPSFPKNAPPIFFPIDGAPDTPAMHCLEQIHALYTKSGTQLEQDYQTHLQATEARKEYLRAHPEKPQDVTIRVWKKDSSRENHTPHAQ